MASLFAVGRYSLPRGPAFSAPPIALPRGLGMTPRGARRVGGGVGVLVAAGVVLWQATRRPPCSGAVFVEFRPPLAAPGPYRFSLSVDQRGPCVFEVPVPMVEPVNTSSCHLALDLAMRGAGESAVLTELIVGAAPRTLQVRVESADEVVYDVTARPRYAEYPVPREDGQRFCGARAHLAPTCRRGSSQCAPFAPVCRSQAECPGRQVCCVDPLQAREHGVRAASRCTSRSTCESSYGLMACQADGDCPRAGTCDDQRFLLEFDPPITVCSLP